MHLSNKDWDIVGPLYRKLEEHQLEKALAEEQARMTRNRPLAIEAVCELIKMIEAEPTKDGSWIAPSEALLLHWSKTRTYMSLAISGQADGYFSEVYPWPDEMLRALYAQG